MVSKRQAARAVAVPLIWAAGMALTRHYDPLITISITAAIVLLIGTPASSPAGPPASPPAALGALAAIAQLTVTYLTAPFFRSAKPLLTLMTGGRSPLTALAFVIPIVIAEEVIWRRRYEELMPRPRALFCAIVYALAHATRGSLLLVGVAFVCGFYWSLLRERTGGIAAPLIAHLAWDIAIIVFPPL